MSWDDLPSRQVSTWCCHPQTALSISSHSEYWRSCPLLLTNRPPTMQPKTQPTHTHRNFSSDGKLTSNRWHRLLCGRHAQSAPNSRYVLSGVRLSKRWPAKRIHKERYVASPMCYTSTTLVSIATCIVCSRHSTLPRPICHTQTAIRSQTHLPSPSAHMVHR